MNALEPNRVEDDRKAMVESTPDVIFRLDVNLRYIYISPSIKNHTETRREQFLGKTIHEIPWLGHDSNRLAEQCRQVIATGEEIRKEFESGDSCYRTRIIPEISMDGAVESLLGITADVTDGTFTRHDHFVRQQRYESLINSIDGIVWELDCATWKFTFVSKRAEQLLGYPVSAWLADAEFWTDHMHPDDRVWAPDLCMEATERGEDHQFEYRMIAADGRVVWLRDIVTVEQVGGRPVRLCGVLVDVTKRKKEEAFAAGQRLILEMIAARAPLPHVLASLVLLVESQSAGMLCSALLLDNDGVTVRHGAAPSLPEAYIQAIEGSKIGPDAGSCGTAMYLGKPVIVTDILGDSRWNHYRDKALAWGLRACSSWPILSLNGQALGSFAIYYSEARGPSAEETALIEAVTHIAGIAIERQRAEELLRASEERYRALVTASAAHVWRTNERGETLFLSSGWRELTGQNEEEIRGFGWMDAIHPNDRLPCRQLWESAVKAKEPYESEFRVRTHKGDYRIFASRGVPLLTRDSGVREWVGINTDITERRLAEKTSHETELRNQATLRAIPDLMFLFSADGVYLDFHATNPSALLVPPDQFLGKNIRDILPAQLAKTFARLFKAAASGELQTIEYDLPMHGGIKHFEARIVPGGGDNILTIVRDITERKVAEQALRGSAQELHRSHRQIRELTGKLMVAHEEERGRISRELHDDLNQKVAALSIHISNVKRQLTQPARSLVLQLENVQECIHDLENGIRQLSRRLHPATLERFGLGEALTSFVTEFSRLEGIEVKLNIPSSRVAIPREAAICLYRVAQECLRNVAKHSGAKSAEVTLSLVDNAVTLLVQDNGRGFDLEDAHGSDGLGLVSMEERVRLVQGSITFSAQPGMGTKLFISIPLTKGND